MTSVVRLTPPRPPSLLQCLQNQSSDIRLVSERVLWWVFKDPVTPVLEGNLMKPLLKSLLDNTKDKNTSVRAQSEHTIVNLLHLRQGEETMQVRLQALLCYTHTHTHINMNMYVLICPCCPIQGITAILDSASNDLLSECHRRSLKKIASMSDSNEEIDDTILT